MGKHSLFNTHIWIAGKIDRDIRSTASSFGARQFWAGPLDENGNSPSNCKRYDKIWEIRKEDIEGFINGNGISNNLKSWPWRLGAPVIDGDGNTNNYNIAGGDLPELLGDQRLWWIMNDRGNVHESLESEPLGLEVHASAFAFANIPPVSNFTFYSYTLINKNQLPLQDAYMGLWSFPNLGDFSNDYIGSDSLLHLGYYYNANNQDKGRDGYGNKPPAIGFTFLQTPLAEADGLDNDRDGIFDEPGEMLGTTGTIWHNGAGTGSILGLAYSREAVYSYLRSRWQNGARIAEGFVGVEAFFPDNFSGKPTQFVFPGDPTLNEFWTEGNYDNAGNSLTPGGGRYFLVSTGPFDIAPNDTATVNFAIIWSRGEDRLDSVRLLKSHTQAVRSSADLLYTPARIEADPIPPIQYVLGFDQNFPNPFSQSTTLRYSLPQPMQVRLAVYDMLGREVALLVDAQQEAGIYTAVFDARDLPAGVYLARIELDFLQFHQTAWY